jgi:hypothetical protein|tara:strand:- start:71 stop:538 length:468 start_codon:yes stop_codon:yes gene_type:complete
MQIQEPTTIEQAIRLVLHYVGIVKLTKANVKKVYKRSKQLQVLMNGGGFWEGRMPYLKELQDNIGYTADVTVTHDDKKWEKVLLTELSNIADQWCIQEEEHLAKEEEADEEDGSKTINEENEEASKQLEELANRDVIQLDKKSEESEEAKEKYPY